VNTKTQRPFVLVRIRVGFHILSKCFEVNFTGAVFARGLGDNSLVPTSEARNTNRKTQCRLLKAQAFLLFDGKDMAAEINRIGHDFNIITLKAAGYIFNDGLVGICEKYLRKGSKVYIEGQLVTRKWQDQSGNDRYSTEVTLQGYNSKLIMLDGKSDGQGGGSSYASGGIGGGASGGGYSSDGSSRPSEFPDDEIPF